MLILFLRLAACVVTLTVSMKLIILGFDINFLGRSNARGFLLVIIMEELLLPKISSNAESAPQVELIYGQYHRSQTALRKMVRLFISSPERTHARKTGDGHGPPSSSLFAHCLRPALGCRLPSSVHHCCLPAPQVLSTWPRAAAWLCARH